MNETTAIHPLYLAALAFLIYTFFAAAMFYISAGQVVALHKFKTTERSIFKKQAVQSLSLVMVISLVFFALSLADFMYFKKIYGQLSARDYNLIKFIPPFACVCFVLTLAWKTLVQKATKINFIHYLLGLVTTLAHLINTCFIFVISFYFLFAMNNIAPASVDAEVNSSTFVALTNAFMAFLAPGLDAKNGFMLDFAFYILAFIFIMPALAYTLQMQSTLMVRKLDDYGRDYYMQTIKKYSKSALHFSECLTCLIVVIVGFSMYEPDKLPFALPMTEALAALLMFPLATVSLYIITKSENPLRHKIAIYTAPILHLFPSIIYILLTR